MEFRYRPSDATFEYQIEFLKRISDNWRSNSLAAFKKVLVVIDGSLRKSQTDPILRTLSRHSIATTSMSLPRRAAKSFGSLRKIWDTSVQASPDAIVGIGGGTVCDLAGFAAATYQRGVARILFPSTVLGMVDACIGGKTAIDFGKVKNSIGAVQYPLLCVNVLSLLETLPPAELRSGFAEVVKAAVIGSPQLFNRLEKVGRAGQVSRATLIEILWDSSRIKATICEQTKRDAKIQLLYGHAIGHALESLAHLRHGECVAIGMSLEGALACLAGKWTTEEWRAQEYVLRGVGLPTQLPANTNLKKLVSRMLLYKKLVVDQQLRIVVPSRVGAMAHSGSGFGLQIPSAAMESSIREAIAWTIKYRTARSHRQLQVAW